MSHRFSIMTVICVLAAQAATAQVTSLFPKVTRSAIYNYVVPSDTPTDGDEPAMNMLFFDGEELVEDNDSMYIDDRDSLYIHFKYDPFNACPLPQTYFRPTVFDRLHILKPFTLETDMQLTPGLDPPVTEWLTRAEAQEMLMERVRQRYIVDYPYLIKYDEAHLPEPPKEYTATVDPATASILLREVIPTSKEIPKTEMGAKFGKKHWLRSFNVNLQFSQAYLSPNWYQGGNNNLNALLDLSYEVKLNKAFHPKLLFDNSFKYKLGMNNAPDDELRDYNISEDIFQWNMTFGYKSTKRWYYSTSVQFKTQFLNNYKPNSTKLKAAFLSPGELNIGVGMTYNYTNPKKTLTFDASISPLSYNMKTCLRKRMNVTSYGIEEGHKTVSEYGSSAEGKLSWKLCDNISLKSRLFVFSDYEYIQSDWENTLQFTINRYLSTQIYVHMRYDSTSPVVEDTEWHKFMLKEILSFGFTYKFATK